MALVKIEAPEKQAYRDPQSPRGAKILASGEISGYSDVSFFEKHEDMVQLKCMVVKCSVMSWRVGKSKNMSVL